MIYDDDEMTADYFATALQNDAMNATFVTDPHALLENLEKFDSRCVIFEYEYTSVLWTQIIEAIRQQDKFMSMPILFISSGYTEEVENMPFRLVAMNCCTNQLVSTIWFLLFEQERLGHVNSGLCQKEIP